jgi:cytochrome c2
LPAASFADPSLTQFSDPDKTIRVGRRGYRVLKEYLKNPRAKVPGTKMIFPGLPKDEDIDDVIAYLEQFGADGKKS